MRFVSLAFALAAAVLSLIGLVLLFRIDPNAYGAKPPPPGSHPAETIRQARDEQRASQVSIFLREQKRATAFVLAGAVCQVVATLVGLGRAGP